MCDSQRRSNTRGDFSTFVNREDLQGYQLLILKLFNKCQVNVVNVCLLKIMAYELVVFIFLMCENRLLNQSVNFVQIDELAFDQWYHLISIIFRV